MDWIDKTWINKTWLYDQIRKGVFSQVLQEMKLIEQNRTLIESSSKGFLDTIYNDMNTLNTKLLKL